MNDNVTIPVDAETAKGPPILQDPLKDQPPLVAQPQLHPDADPAQIAHKALQSVIDQQTQQGLLKVPNTPQPGGTLYNVNSFLQYLNLNRADVPPFKGAQQPAGNWVDQVQQLVGGAEGLETRAYWDPLSQERKVYGTYVQPGQKPVSDKPNITIGYGYNITGNSDSRDVFKKQLGFSDADYDAVLNGTKTITADQALKLRDYKLYEMNGYLNNMVKVPLTDYQRAALVSMVYNFGPGGFNKTGIPAALNAGKSPQEVAQLIKNASPAQKKLQSRRDIEAATFLGARGGSALASQPGPSAPLAQGDSGADAS